MEYVIGVDLGTSGTKTVLFDRTGRTIAASTVEYPMYQPYNGWAEQEPEDWVNAAFTTIRDVLEKSQVDPADIAGLSLSGQMHGLVLTDDSGKALGRSIIWCDNRTIESCDEFTRLVGGREELIRISANPALTGFTAGKILWTREHLPEVWAKARRIQLPKDYVRLRLTGELASASGREARLSRGEDGGLTIAMALSGDRIAAFHFERESEDALSEALALQIVGTCTDVW